MITHAKYTKNGDNIRAAVRKFADEKPGFIYKSPRYSTVCKYFDKSKPSCIMGHAALELSMELKPFKDADDQKYLPGINNVLDAIYGVNKIDDIDYETMAWCSRVQRNQDFGLPWGKSVQEADEMFKNIALRDRKLGVLA